MESSDSSAEIGDSDHESLEKENHLYPMIFITENENCPQSVEANIHSVYNSDANQVNEFLALDCAVHHSVGTLNVARNTVEKRKEFLRRKSHSSANFSPLVKWQADMYPGAGQPGHTFPGTDSHRTATRADSFRSVMSYGSFRSCHTYKSMGGVSGMSRASFKSCTSKWTNKDGFTNQAFYDFDDRADTVSFRSVCDPGSLELYHTGNSEGGAGGRAGLHKEEEEEVFLTGRQVYLGLFLAALAGLVFAGTNVLVKLVPVIDSWILLLFRCVIQVLLMVPAVLAFRVNPIGPYGSRIRVYIQGLLSGVLLFAIFVAVRRLPLADTAALFLTAPAITLIFSMCIIREHCGLYRFVSFVGLTLGFLLLARPAIMFPQFQPKMPENNSEGNVLENSTFNLPTRFKSDFHLLIQYNILGWPVGLNYTQEVVFPEEFPNELQTNGTDPIGIVAALAVPILSAVICVLTRQCQEKVVHFTVILFWQGIGGVLSSLIGYGYLTDHVLLAQLDPLDVYEVKDWILAVVIAVLGLAGNTLFIIALLWAPPGKVMVFRSLEIVAAYILQISIFVTKPIWIDLGGILLIIFSIFFIGLEDVLRQKISWKMF